MNLQEMFSNQLKELKESSKDSTLVKAIETELSNRLDALDSMYSQL